MSEEHEPLHKFCPKCKKFKVSPGNNFCVDCGSHLLIPNHIAQRYKFCPRCKYCIYQDGIDFCPRCGKYFPYKEQEGPMTQEGMH